MSDIEMAQHQGKDSLAQVATQEQQQQHKSQEITFVTTAPAAAAGDTVDSSAQDINTSPPQETQKFVTHISPEAVKAIIKEYKEFPKSESEELDDLRGWLMVLATLTASITWTAAVNPPGGLWQAHDDAKGYAVGTSVFHDKNRDGYRLFVYFNTTSFISSVLMLILLSNSWLFKRTHGTVLAVLVSLDLVSLLATFGLGSSINVNAHSPQVIGILTGSVTLACLVIAYSFRIGIR